MTIDLLSAAEETLKLTGALGAIVAAIALTSRLWRNAYRDKMIEYLKTSLETASALSIAANEARSRLADEAIEMAKRYKDVEVENAALRARPDLESVQSLLEKQSTLFTNIYEALHAHSIDDAKVFTSIQTSLDSISKILVAHLVPKAESPSSGAPS